MKQKNSDNGEKVALPISKKKKKPKKTARDLSL